MATSILTADSGAAAPRSGPKLDHDLHPAGRWIFLAVLVGGLAYAGFSIAFDTAQVGESLAGGAFAFLALALLIALGFEFVNGFHDTANAVATVIYTHSLKPVGAVLWSRTSGRCWASVLPTSGLAAGKALPRASNGGTWKACCWRGYCLPCFWGFERMTGNG